MRRWWIGVLVFGGLVLAGVGKADAGWHATGSMITPRSNHTATLLLSGKVLVTGGALDKTALSASEIFDPATGAWTSSGALNQDRMDHTATLLPSGKVLVVGGRTPFGTTVRNSAELFDPATGAWASTGSLHEGRSRHAATLLPDGNVLVVGGEEGPFDAELYDSTAGTWSIVGGLPARQLASSDAVLLPTTSDSLAVLVPREKAVYTYNFTDKAWTSQIFGDSLPSETATLYFDPGSKMLRVLAAGEQNATIFDTSSLTSHNLQCSPASCLPSNLVTATLLASGKILFTSANAKSVLFDPATQTFSPQVALSGAAELNAHAAVLLPGGGVLVTGGSSASGFIGESAAAEIFEDEPDDSQSTLAIVEPNELGSVDASQVALALLPSGKALALFPSAAFSFDEESMTWSTVALPPAGLTFPLSTTLLSWRDVNSSWITKLMLHSGYGCGTDNNNNPIYFCYYDEGTESWSPAGIDASLGRISWSATGLFTGKVLILDTAGNLNSNSAIFDPSTGQLTPTPPTTPPVPVNRQPTTTLLLSGKVLASGGVLGGDFIGVSSAQIYDPESGQWAATGSLSQDRSGHSAALLGSGNVLVVGGGDLRTSVSAEIYDAASGLWSEIPPPPNATSNSGLTATALPTGRVLVTQKDANFVDLFDPTTGAWESAPQLPPGFKTRAQVLLKSGKLLILGVDAAGKPATAIYDPIATDQRSRASITAPSNAPSPLSVLSYNPFTVEGTGFAGPSEASGGATNNSAVNFPLAQLRSADGLRSWFLPVSGFSNSGVDFSAGTVTLDNLPAGSLEQGLHWLSVVVAGVPSEPVPVNIDCGAKYLAAPEQTTIPLLGTQGPGGEATFSAHCAGADHFQWQRDGIDIPGATGPTYTTIPITAADIGSSYSVVCRSRCDDVNAPASAPTRLQLTDKIAPTVGIVSPSGGELWVLGTDHTISWTMQDNGLICKVAIKLLALTADGIVADTSTLITYDKGAACSFSNQVKTTSFAYTVPTMVPFPAAQGLLYKIEVDVTDQAGNTMVDQSKNPFYLVDPASIASVRALILVNSKRMSTLEAPKSNLMPSVAALEKFPNVPGKIIDLASIDYSAWETCHASQPTSPPSCIEAEEANKVLAAIRLYLAQNVFPTYPNLQYIVLVGNDSIIPFARIEDDTPQKESHYVDVDKGLTTASTVGAALEKDFYLSDDLIGTIATSTQSFPASGKIAATDFVPRYSVGRLVETDDEIVTTIANFLSRNGVLDLGKTGTTDPKVLVTGYDFLLDSASSISEQWQKYFADPNAVDSALLAGWATDPTERATQLESHLASGQKLAFLNGHAAHFEEGVPGTNSGDIQGLGTADLLNPPTGTARPDLTGGAIFAVGCHGGLTVPDATTQPDTDHSQDLPQTFLDLGAVAYAANSGYGWGLSQGTGYSERLMVLLVGQLQAAGGNSIAVGDAVRQAKAAYALSEDAADALNQKTRLQWTLYGLPMYGLKIGGPAIPSATSRLLAPRREIPAVEKIGPTTVTRRLTAAAAPTFLTELDLHFDFSGAYRKLNAAGDWVEQNGAVPGCPDPAGCYYTSNGLSTGETGLPILPFFIYDSRLSGTSQHGALWLGGDYVEEEGWKSVIAVAATNGHCTQDDPNCPSGAQDLPRGTHPEPLPMNIPIPTGGNSAGNCKPSDLDLSGLLVVPAQRFAPASAGSAERHRRFTGFDMEILYYNNTLSSVENCQRTGPQIGPPASGAYHRASGSTVSWSVPVTAANGDAVWRVIVLYDLGPDGSGKGAWRPLELADHGDSQCTAWCGSLPLTQGQKLSYMIEAISVHGNVTWLDETVHDVALSTIFEVATPLLVIASPTPTATFGVGDTVQLQGSATDSQGNPIPGDQLAWTVLLHLATGDPGQGVFGPASGATASFVAPPPPSLPAAAGAYLEIQLTATDSQGVSNTVSQRLDPARVPVTLATSPAGLTVTVAGAAVGAPQTFTSWRGYGIDVAAHPQTGAGGESYVFQSWSDGGPPAHTLVTPATPATDTAAFQLSQTAGPFAYNTVKPCRLVDTRLPAGALGGPSLSGGQTRDFTLAGVCRIPRAARAVAVNLTVVSHTGYGYLTIHPVEEKGATTSVINFTPGLTRSNNAILPLGSSGTVAVTYGGLPGTIDLVADAVGYFE